MCSAVCTERQILVLEEDQESVELSKHLQNSLGNTISSLISLKFHTFTSDTATFSLQRLDVTVHDVLTCMLNIQGSICKI